MARYVDVDKLIAEYDRVHIGAPGGARKLMVDAPTADVQEVVHGEWIYHPETFYTKSGFTCSVCKDPMWHSPDVKQAFKYCPHCGAKMDGGAR
jgi:hypothetical protein